jgi:hypothetical protein
VVWNRGFYKGDRKFSEGHHCLENLMSHHLRGNNETIFEREYRGHLIKVRQLRKISVSGVEILRYRNRSGIPATYAIIFKILRS